MSYFEYFEEFEHNGDLNTVLGENLSLVKLKPGVYKLSDLFVFDSGVSTFKVDTYPLQTKTIPVSFKSRIYMSV